MRKDTAGVLVANPEAFDTVPELRRELHDANARIRQYAAEIQKHEIAGGKLESLVRSVLMQHLRRDHRGVAAILDAQLEASPRLREKVEEANEYNEMLHGGKWAEAAEQKQELPAYNGKGEDPWSKETVHELRVALDLANRAGVRLASEHMSLRSLMEGMTAEISGIVIAHMKGDRDALSEAVAGFCAKRVIVKGDPNRQVH